MSCVLRAGGPNFDVDFFLSDSDLVPLTVFHRGQSRFPNSKRPQEQSGMNVSVSVRDFSELPGQIEDAIRFLSENRQELRRLVEFPGIERVEIDFPVEDRDVAVQSDSFPATLLALLGELGIGLVVSRYPCTSAAPKPEGPLC